MPWTNSLEVEGSLALWQRREQLLGFPTDGLSRQLRVSLANLNRRMLAGIQPADSRGRLHVQIERSL